MSESKAPARPDPTKTIEINPEITFGNQTYNRLELQEPTAAMVDKATNQHGAFKIMMVLVSHVSGWPMGAVEKLPVSVLTEAGTYCLSFLPSGPGTGES